MKLFNRRAVLSVAAGLWLTGTVCAAEPAHLLPCGYSISPAGFPEVFDDLETLPVLILKPPRYSACYGRFCTSPPKSASKRTGNCSPASA